MRELAVVIAISMVAAVASAEEQTLSAAYHEALGAYRKGSPSAIRLLTTIVERDEQDPATLKARYFLARALMRAGEWREASAHLITIYGISPAFYKEWSCDYLLGETRRRLGES